MSDTFLSCINRCQCAAIDGGTNAIELLNATERLAPDLLTLSQPAERIPFASVLFRLLARCAELLGLAAHPDAGAALVKLAGSAAIQPSSVESIHTAIRVMRAQAQRASAGQDPSARLLALIDVRFAERDFNLRQAAAALERSVSHLSHELKRSTGHGFREHLRTRRVAQAKALLAEGSLSIKAVAYDAGFNDSATFARQFRSATGCSPTAFRRRHSARPSICQLIASDDKQDALSAAPRSSIIGLPIQGGD